MSILCRVCGEPIYNVRPRNLFKHKNNDIRVNIEALTGIKLTYDSQMPSHICSCCYLDLEHSISFRTRCIATHTHLMNANNKQFSDSQFPSTKTKLEPINPLDDEGEHEIGEHEDFMDCFEDMNELSPKEATPPIQEGTNCLSTKVRIRRRRDPNIYARKVTKLKKKQPYTNLEKNFVCDVCGWSFRDISNLKSHALRHSGEKKFKCNECNRQFFDNSQLRLHVRVHHQGEKPFVCKYCGMAFRNSPTRCRHERKFHANQLPFECDLCSRTFITQISLNSHKLVHVTGEKIHHCQTCNKTFKEVGSLKKHYSTKFHQKRLNHWTKDDRNLDNLEKREVGDEDIDFDFPDSIIEEVDE